MLFNVECSQLRLPEPVKVIPFILSSALFHTYITFIFSRSRTYIQRHTERVSLSGLMFVYEVMLRQGERLKR